MSFSDMAAKRSADRAKILQSVRDIPCATSGQKKFDQVRSRSNNAISRASADRYFHEIVFPAA